MIMYVKNEKILIKNVKMSNFESFWNGQDVGNIDNLTNEIYILDKYLVFHCDFYFVIEKYTILNHYVEILKYLFDIPMRPFNICTFRGLKYFMFPIDPNYESEIQVHKIKISEFTDEQRIIGIFHWIIGVKGKILEKYTDNGSIYTSRGQYILDYFNNELKDLVIKKYLPTVEIKRHFYNFFSKTKKIQLISEFLSEHLLWSWYQTIIQRIEMLS